MLTTVLFILVTIASVVGVVWFFVHVARNDSPYAAKVPESERIEPGGLGDYEAKPVPLDDLFGGSAGQSVGKDRDS